MDEQPVVTGSPSGGAAALDLTGRAPEDQHLVAVVTHELRTPMASLVGLVDVLRNRWSDLSDEDRERTLDALARQGRRLTALVEDLLLLATLQTGTLSVQLAPLRLADLIAQVVDDLGLGHAADVAVDPELVVEVDDLRLIQILTNLLSNADRYGAPPISVATTLVMGDGVEAVELRVSDTGPGVAAGEVGAMFDSFVTAARPASGGVRGTGLGLAIVRSLARAHGGDAWYEPVEPQGACVVVRLPVSAQVESHPPSG